MPPTDGRTRAHDSFRSLLALHADVDRLAGACAEIHAARLVCRRGCAQCCVDDITVFEIEAERIRREHSDLLERRTPHAEGACAFLDTDGACRIYADRPYVCRTQGLPLRWIDQDDAGGGREYRDICPLNESTGEPVERIPAAECWTLGPFEARLARLQVDVGGTPPRRVRLRDLFQGGA